MRPVVGALLAVVPFAFAAIRWLQTGEDLRYLWMALASSVCAAPLLRSPGSRARITWRRVGMAAFAASACAAVTGVLLGARSGLGIGMVAAGFGVTSAVGMALIARVRADPRP